jgi:hypothetical protein
MGADALRSSRGVGWPSTDDDIDAFCAALPQVLERLAATATENPFQ